MVKAKILRPKFFFEVAYTFSGEVKKYFTRIEKLILGDILCAKSLQETILKQKLVGSK